VFVDSASDGFAPLGFAWSPDGNHIAHLRQFAHAKYNEIVIRDLANGREKQITNERKTIDAIAWTPQNEIVFSSDRGGARNLWIMHATGGVPAQITRGGGADWLIGTSADGRTLLYGVEHKLVDVGWWDVASGEHGHTTQGDEPLDAPLAPSPDGRQIILRALDPTSGWIGSGLLVMDRNGGNRRRIVTGGLDVVAYDWSPDGSRIVWDSVNPGAGDSLRRHIADSRSGEDRGSYSVPTRGGFGYVYWIAADTILSADNHGSLWYSLFGKRVVRRTQESVFAYPNQVPGWTVLTQGSTDTSSAGVYISPVNGGSPHLVMPDAWRCSNPSESPFLYCWPESLGFRRLELPSGRLTRIAHEPPEGRADYFRPARNGRVVFWIKNRDALRLSLIEGLHD
jgi:dipeptidyl aminopeptidase/acylaminoacyl peptidase